MSAIERARGRWGKASTVEGGVTHLAKSAEAADLYDAVKSWDGGNSNQGHFQVSTNWAGQPPSSPGEDARRFLESAHREGQFEVRRGDGSTYWIDGPPERSA